MKSKVGQKKKTAKKKTAPKKMAGLKTQAAVGIKTTPPKPGDAKYEKNADGTFTKYVYEQGSGWVDEGDVAANQVPASQGGTGVG